MSADRELDVVVFGATGFVGRLVAGYLAGHAPGGVRIGLAGRSERRLADVRAGLGAAASAWPLLTADSADPVSLAALARAPRVVATTVGPYSGQGLALVEACAAAGTHYADLTGEVLFVRDSIDRCHAVAASTGARIVHCCGFDSVPSDLGALLLHHAARADDAGDLQDTTLVVAALRGGISGGTVASLLGQQDEVRARPERRKVVGDPYALSPDRAAEPDLGDERDLDWASHDRDLRMWVGPWVMAGINTRVVRRSNALQDWAYGRRFRYREVTGFGASLAAPVLAATVSSAAKAAEAGLAFGPSRAVLSHLLPAPGHGPGEKTRRTGFFRMEIHTRTSAGVQYLATIQAQGDPGYAATSVMLGETALCLALDRDHLPDRAGVLTPATAMGAALAGRLRSAGHTLATRQITRLARRSPGYPADHRLSQQAREDSAVTLAFQAHPHPHPAPSPQTHPPLGPRDQRTNKRGCRRASSVTSSSVAAVGIWAIAPSTRLYPAFRTARTGIQAARRRPRHSASITPAEMTPRAAGSALPDISSLLWQPRAATHQDRR